MKNKCVKRKEVEVLQSNAGYYIGTMEGNEPYCRLSVEYFSTREEAEVALKNRLFTERNSMETQFCNGGHRNCLV